MNEIQIEIVVPNQTRYLGLIGTIGERIAREVDRYSGDLDMLAYHVNLVLTEAMANAIEHGHQGEAGGNKVRIVIHIEGDTLCIQVYDQGKGFEMECLPEPDAECLDERGRGIFFMRSLMDSVSYQKTETGNVLEMRKRLA